MVPNTKSFCNLALLHKCEAVCQVVELGNLRGKARSARSRLFAPSLRASVRARHILYSAPNVLLLKVIHASCLRAALPPPDVRLFSYSCPISPTTLRSFLSDIDM